MAGFLTEPTRSEYDSSDVEGAFRSVIELLRTSHDREHGFDSEVSTTSAAKDSNAALVGNKSPKMALNDRIIAIECPSLSLRHLGHLNIGKNSRVQAEMESAALLARPLLVEMNPPPTENGSIRIDDLPSVLMNNLYESFAILVDSRLHVYSKIFFRHLSSLISKHADAFGILQMGQKLETLHDIGGQITASSMQVHTELHDVEPEEDSEGVFQQGFKLEAVMELHVPCPTGQSRTLVVRHSGEGCLRGVVREEDKKLQVTITVDTQEFLKSMMDQASLMVSQIVETTNEAFSIPGPKMERGESFFVMPPPKPRKQPAAVGLDLLSEVAGVKETVIITPDLSSKNSDMSLVPSLQLHHNEEEDTDTNADDVSVDDLSVDQCASIIDDVFGYFDDALLQGPPLKKAKTSE